MTPHIEPPEMKEVFANRLVEDAMLQLDWKRKYEDANRSAELHKSNYSAAQHGMLQYHQRAWDMSKANLDLRRGIERKNRQLKVLKQRLADYETLRRWVKRYTKRDMNETDIVDFLSRTVKFYTAYAESNLWCPPKPDVDVSSDVQSAIVSGQSK